MEESGNYPEVIDRLHNSVIGLANTFAPSFKKRPERLSKPAALDTFVFFKIAKMLFSEAVAKLKESLWKTVFKVNLFGYLRSFFKKFPARLE